MKKFIDDNKKVLIFGFIVVIVLGIIFFMKSSGKNYTMDKNGHKIYNSVNVVFQDNLGNKYNAKISEKYKDCFLNNLKLKLVSSDVVEKSFSLPKKVSDCIIKKGRFTLNEISKKGDMVFSDNLLHMLKSEVKVKYKKSIKLSN